MTLLMFSKLASSLVSFKFMTLLNRNLPQDLQEARRYLLVSRIEKDLRQVIAKQICPNFYRRLDFISDMKVKEEAFFRLRRDYPEIEINGKDIEYKILPYLNSLDPVAIIRSNKPLIDNDDFKHIQENHLSLEKFLGKTRSSIMHTRDVDDEEAVKFYDFCQKISRESKIWSQLKTIIDRLPTMNQEILIENKNEIIPKDIHSKIFHGLQFSNLPEEDYLGWNFVGRKTFLTKVQKELFESDRNLIGLHGPGGIGKTAIARYICEKQLGKTNVELIWWHSSKTRSFSENQIKAHAKQVPLLEDIEAQIKEKTGFSIKQLKELKPLYVLDNMENQKEDVVMSVAHKLSSNGKVILTGRNEIPGLGAYPIEINGFKSNESTIFLNRVGTYYAQKAILEADEGKKIDWCNKLENSPLFIRNFVEAVKEGKSPKEYFSKFNEYDSIIDFVFFNVRDNFTDDANTLISLLELDSSALSPALLKECVEWDGDRLTEALNIIRRSPLIESTNISDLAHYKLTDLARRYIKKHKKQSKLKSDFEREKIIQNISNREEFKKRDVIKNIEDISYFQTYDEQENLAGYDLNKALRESQKINIEERIHKLLDLKQKWLDFSPIYLNLAVAYAETSQPWEAKNHFESALDYCNEELNREKILFQYIKFLVNENDIDRAKQFFNELNSNQSISCKLLGIELNMDPSDPESLNELYRLFEQSKLPSEKINITQEMLRLVINVAEKLFSRENYLDSKWFLDNFLQKMNGQFKLDTFGETNINFFVSSFLKLYVDILKKFDSYSDNITHDLTAFVDGRDFVFNSRHFDLFMDLKDHADGVVIRIMHESLGLDGDVDWQLYLNNKELEETRKGKIISLNKTRNGDGMGFIETRDGETLVFYENTVKDGPDKYYELEVQDTVKWEKILNTGQEHYTAQEVSKL